MFRRTDVGIPQDVDFPEDLEGLGLEINANRQFIDKLTGQFYQFDKYDMSRTNQLRYGAIHKAVRHEVHDRLSAVGVGSLYLYTGNDNDTSEASKKKPTCPSIKILSTIWPPVKSRNKVKDLFIFVGDSKQDLGILSRKAIMTEGGLCNGSVLGLVEALRDAAKPADTDDYKLAVANTPKKVLPSVAILNTGELLWSHEFQECMSAVTWQDRKRAHAFADQCQITEEHNRVDGHISPESHVGNCLQSYLMSAAGTDTRVRIVTVGDGSEHVLNYLDSVYTTKPDTKPAKLEIDIAMVQPSHNDDIVKDPVFKKYLAEHARIWEAHSEPKGTLLADVGFVLRSPFFDDESKSPAFDDEPNSPVFDDESNDSEYDLPPPTPPGEYSQRNEPIDYFRGPGLTMAIRRRLPAAEEPKADKKEGLKDSVVAPAQSSTEAFTTFPIPDVKVSMCKRLSAGIEDTADMIFPVVMDDILEFFEERRNAAMMEGFGVEKGWEKVLKPL